MPQIDAATLDATISNGLTVIATQLQRSSTAKMCLQSGLPLLHDMSDCGDLTRREVNPGLRSEGLAGPQVKWRMQDRRDREHAASKSRTHDANHAARPGPGKQTLTGVAELQAQTASTVPNDKLNVDIDHLNKKHPGIDTARLGVRPEDEAAIAKLKKAREDSHDPKQQKKLSERIAAIRNTHFAYKTLHAASMYDIDGRRVQPIIPAHTAALINAGAITKLVLDPDPTHPNKPAVDCVFVFQTYKADGTLFSANGGWMMASNFTKAVESEQKALSKEISHERDDAHHQFASQPIPVANKTGANAAVDGIQDLYTYPPPFQKHHENLAIYYYSNLSLNVPRTGQKRFGVEATRLPHNSTSLFYPQVPYQHISIPLFAHGSKTPVLGKQLTFIYGYVVDDAGAKIYGWINQLMIPTFVL